MMDTKDFNKVVSALRAGTLSQQQRNTLITVIREQQARGRAQNRQVLRRLGRGAKVKWNGKYGPSTGVLQRILRKNAEVLETSSGMIWRIPMQMLEVADA